jgi:hypothetical protein
MNINPLKIFFHTYSGENMYKKSLLLSTAFILILGFLMINSDCRAGDTGPVTMELKTVTNKKPARFTHKKHQETFACEQCHHTKTEDGVRSPYIEGMGIKKCAFCHNNTDMTNPKLNSFKLAAHGLCKECHKQNRGSAPTKCSGCHIK